MILVFCQFTHGISVFASFSYGLPKVPLLKVTFHICQLSRIIQESPVYGTEFPLSRTGHQISWIKQTFELFCALVWSWPIFSLKICTFLFHGFLGHFCTYLVTEKVYFVITMMKMNFDSMLFIWCPWRQGKFVAGGVREGGCWYSGGGGEGGCSAK